MERELETVTGLLSRADLLSDEFRSKEWFSHTKFDEMSKGGKNLR